jgi:hypothetical protein
MALDRRDGRLRLGHLLRERAPAGKWLVTRSADPSGLTPMRRRTISASRFTRLHQLPPAPTQTFQPRHTIDSGILVATRGRAVPRAVARLQTMPSLQYTHGLTPHRCADTR